MAWSMTWSGARPYDLDVTVVFAGGIERVVMLHFTEAELSSIPFARDHNSWVESLVVMKLEPKNQPRLALLRTKCGCTRWLTGLDWLPRIVLPMIGGQRSFRYRRTQGNTTVYEEE